MPRVIFAVLIIVIRLTASVGAANAQEKLTATTKLSGVVLKLSEVTGQEFHVNLGGLVIVIVRDSGSRPPQDIKVDAPRSFQPLGVVRGTQTDKGEALMGGGYTWYLFTPVTSTAATIKVSYTENGEQGKRVDRAYKVHVDKRP